MWKAAVCKAAAASDLHLLSPPSHWDLQCLLPRPPTLTKDLGFVLFSFTFFGGGGGGGGGGLRKVLTLYPWLFWNPLWPGWPQTQIHGKSPASTSWVPGLRVCVARPSCFGFIWGFNISDCSYYLLLLYYSLKDHILVFICFFGFASETYVNFSTKAFIFFFLFPVSQFCYQKILYNFKKQRKLSICII